jgi:hypothetical protein
VSADPNTAACPMCGQSVGWVTVTVAASILGVQERRIRELLEHGRLSGSKHKPPGGTPAFWRVRLDSIAGLLRAREEGQR